MEAGSRLEFDVIVVGSGPAGATVARGLSARGRSVLLLERGAELPVDDSAWRKLRVMRADFIGGGIAVVKGITTGGTSMLYFACAFEPPLEMFRSYGIDLSMDVEEIRKQLPIAELPDHCTGKRARRIMSSARDLGYEWKKLEKFVYPDRCDEGCPYEARWNARAFVREAQQHGAVLKTRARARKVLVVDQKAVGVEFEEAGALRTASADKVVLAAGGVGTPVILRSSGVQKAGEGFFCDPLVIVHGSVSDIRSGEEVPMVAGVHLPEDGYLMTDLALPWHLYGPGTVQALRFDRLFANPRTLSIMVKVKDEIGGTVSDTGRVRKRFSREDLARLGHGAGRARGILENAGAKHVFQHRIIAAHPGGTARIGHVVDSDLRTEVENLYVCDCSVIPEAWGLPPTFTLIALAGRLVRHLVPDEA